MLKTHHGSCHCGAVKFEADIDLEAGTGKCNCSICTKKRGWNAQIKPEAFRLLTDPAALSDYQFGSNSAHHVFCKACGVSAFGHGYVEEIGGAYVLTRLKSRSSQAEVGAPGTCGVERRCRCLKLTGFSANNVVGHCSVTL